MPIIESAVALDSEYVPAWLYMGVWLNALGRYVDAREAFARAHALGAMENADAGTARALIGERRYEEALAVLVPWWTSQASAGVSAARACLPGPWTLG